MGGWTGYKLGGVIALFTAEYFQNMGVEEYWQSTFLVLGVVIILMNIGLMFVHEPIETDSQAAKPAKPAPAVCISLIACAGTSFDLKTPNKSTKLIKKYLIFFCLEILNKSLDTVQVNTII